jgi:hypothetical protein
MLFSLTIQGKTIFLTLISGADTVWKNYQVRLDYSYISSTLDEYFIIHKIEPRYDEYDKSNTVSIGLNSLVVEKLINKGCLTKEVLCTSFDDGFIKFIAFNLPGYQKFYFKENCDAYLFYKGMTDKEYKYKEFIQRFFKNNCL